MMWRQFQFWRALGKLNTVRRIVAVEEYDGKPVVWQALRLVDSLESKIRVMRRGEL